MNLTDLSCFIHMCLMRGHVISQSASISLITHGTTLPHSSYSLSSRYSGILILIPYKMITLLFQDIVLLIEILHSKNTL